MTNDRFHRARHPRRKGMALLVVVVLVLLISLGAYRFSFYMESQYRLTRMHEERVHARLAALSGLELATAIVEMPAAKRSDLGGLHENPSILQHIPIEQVLETGPKLQEESVWRFSLLSPRTGDATREPAQSSSSQTGERSLSIRFGLENESAKLHIPTLLAWNRLKPGHARLTLLGLPGMDENMVDAWLSELGISQSMDRGGNLDQHASLDDIKHGWFGGDLNQNYQLDPLEIRFENQRLGPNRINSLSTRDRSSSTTTFQPLQRYLTWYSGHRNMTREGQPRVNLNETDLRSLHQKLSMIWPPDRVNFVIALRQFGPSISLAAGPAVNLPGGAISGLAIGSPLAQNASGNIVQDWAPDFSKSAVFSFRSPLDLVGTVVDLPATVGASGPNRTATLAKRTLLNPFSSDLASVRNYLERVLDDVTVNASPILEGRIDVTEAPVEVLAGVPGLDLALAQRIVQQRNAIKGPSTTTQSLDAMTWLLDSVDLNKLKELEPYLTFRSDVYSVQSVGYRDNQSAVYRITATIDACQYPIQLRNRKVWHPWDRGFSIEQLADSKP